MQPHLQIVNYVLPPRDFCCAGGKPLHILQEVLLRLPPQYLSHRKLPPFCDLVVLSPPLSLASRFQTLHFELLLFSPTSLSLSYFPGMARFAWCGVNPLPLGFRAWLSPPPPISPCNFVNTLDWGKGGPANCEL
jgi:hypothetical protein